MTGVARAPARRRAGPIRSLTSLREHLQTALAVEHSTIPPYFTAWLSIREGRNLQAARIIHGVMVEEMLHLTLVANVLNAVGGRPRLAFPGFTPRYPHRLPHCRAKFRIHIERFSPRALDTFLKIERPEKPGARPQPGRFDTLGQFYDAVGEGLEYLCEQLGDDRVFTGKPSRQIRPEDYYGSGKLIVVTDRASARWAMREIVEQGEGMDHTIFDADPQIFGPGREYAHYFRFKEIREGRYYSPRDTPASEPSGRRLGVDYDAVYPMRANTRLADYPPGSEIRSALEQFAQAYGVLLTELERSFNGSPERLMGAVARMFQLRDLALALMRTPSGRGNTTVGPAFEPRFPSSR